MFYKEKFANILLQIKEKYTNQEEFAKYSGVGRTSISQYMNCKIDKPPKPKILEKIANSSKGITNYNELMEICGYIDENVFTNNSNVNHDISVLPLFIIENSKLIQYSDLWVDKQMLEYGHEYFALKSNSDSMLPLVRHW